MDESTSAELDDAREPQQPPHRQTLVEAIVDSSFVQNQDSLSTERGIALNVLMVGAAAAMCGALAFFWFRS